MAELAELLRSGVSAQGAVYGPMAEVVGASLQHLRHDDVDAMALYLASLPAPARERSVAAAPEGREAMLRLGAGLYEANCASCHGADGQGKARIYPRLAGRAHIASANAVRMLLHGGYGPSTAANPWPYGMPPFAGALTDVEAAAVLSYLRTSWGNQGTLVTPLEVGRLRGTPAH